MMGYLKDPGIKCPRCKKGKVHNSKQVSCDLCATPEEAAARKERRKMYEAWRDGKKAPKRRKKAVKKSPAKAAKKRVSPMKGKKRKPTITCGNCGKGKVFFRKQKSCRKCATDEHKVARKYSAKYRARNTTPLTNEVARACLWCKGEIEAGNERSSCLPCQGKILDAFEGMGGGKEEVPVCGVHGTPVTKDAPCPKCQKKQDELDRKIGLMEEAYDLNIEFQDKVQEVERVAVGAVSHIEKQRKARIKKKLAAVGIRR